MDSSLHQDLPFDDFLPSRWRNDEDDFLRNSKHHHHHSRPTTTSKTTNNNNNASSSVAQVQASKLASDRSMSTGGTHIMDEDYQTGASSGEEDAAGTTTRRRGGEHKKDHRHANKESQGASTNQQRLLVSRKEALKNKPTLGSHLLGSSSSLDMMESTHSGLASIAEENAGENDASTASDDDFHTVRSGSPPIDDRDKQFLESIQDEPLLEINPRLSQRDNHHNKTPAPVRRRRSSLIVPQGGSHMLMTNEPTTTKTSKERDSNKKWKKPAWASRVATGLVPTTPDSKNANKNTLGKKKGLLDSLLGHTPPSTKSTRNPRNLSPMDEMSVGAESMSSQGAHLRGDLRQSLLRMNSVMNKSATFSMTPEELQVREMRPWRKQSQLRSAKVSMQSAALAVQAELEEEEEEEDIDDGRDSKSEVDSVCYQIPDEFQRTPQPQKKEGVAFDDVWGPGGSPQEMDEAPKESRTDIPSLPLASRQTKERASKDVEEESKGKREKHGDRKEKQNKKERKSSKRLQKEVSNNRSTSSDMNAESKSKQVDDEFEDLFAMLENTREKRTAPKTAQTLEECVSETASGAGAEKPKKKKKSKRSKSEAKVPSSPSLEVERSNTGKAVAHLGEKVEAKVPSSPSLEIERRSTDKDVAHLGSESKKKKYKRDDDPKLHNLVIDIDDSSEASSLSGHFGNTSGRTKEHKASTRKKIKKSSSNKEVPRQPLVAPLQATSESKKTDRRTCLARSHSEKSSLRIGGQPVPGKTSRLGLATSITSRPWSPSDSQPRPLVNAKLKARDTRSKREVICDVEQEDADTHNESKSKTKKKSKKKKKKKSKEKERNESSSRPSLQNRSTSERFEFIAREPSLRSRGAMSVEIVLPVDVDSTSRADWEGHRKLKTGKEERKIRPSSDTSTKSTSRKDKERRRAKERERASGGTSSSVRRGRSEVPGERRKERRRASSVPKTSSDAVDVDQKRVEKPKRRERRRSSSVSRAEKKQERRPSGAEKLHREGSGGVSSRSGSGRSLWSESTSSHSQLSRAREMFTRRLLGRDST